MTPERRNARYAMQVLTTPVASVGHTLRAVCERRLAAVLMAEQMHRIVLRDADQREAERERDAVHRAEHRADRRKPGDAGAGDAAARRARRRRAPIRDEQQHDQADRCRSCRASVASACVRPFISTENAPGPLTVMRTVCSPRVSSKCLRKAAAACSWPSGSNAAAFVATTRMALSPALSNHTSNCFCGCFAGCQCFRELQHLERRIARNQRLEHAAAGDDRSCSRSLKLIAKIRRIEPR